MIFSIYATFEQMHGRRSSIGELVEGLRPYSRDSVIYVCSLVGSLLKLWDRGAYDLAYYDQLISRWFEYLRGDWYKLAARFPEPELVFHRRQVMLITKLAVLHCLDFGRDLRESRPGEFGTMLLMANDHFHYGFTAETSLDELDKVERLLAEFVPVNEDAGFRVEHKIVRAHLMLHKYPNELREHPEFVDIAREFEVATNISLADYEALCFGLFVKYGTLTIETLQREAALAVRAHNFFATVVPKETIARFLGEMTTTPESLSSHIRKRDFGANDFAELRKRPLISSHWGYLPADILFVAEKIETGPYWTVNDTNRRTGDKLRRFWGTVFEKYVNDLLAESLRGTDALFIPDPRRLDDPGSQICDSLIVQGDSLVLLEYKSSMFRADTKYSGNYKLLTEEIERKLVRDTAEGKKKGVEQLAEGVAQLFTDKKLVVVRDLDLRNVNRVYPLLVTLDGIGGSLLMSRFLNHHFSARMDRAKFPDLEIKPLLCTDVEGLEEVAGCFQRMSLVGFLDHWLTNDPSLRATLMTFTVDEMLGHKNAFMGREWRALSEQIGARLFPNEHATAKKAQTP